MNGRGLRCVLLPPFHHDWKLVENLGTEHREPGFRSGASWADPTLNEFREYEVRCARCGKESWWGESDAPAWGRWGGRAR
ncbi:MAG TPA: hypothetical protein VFM57_07200 [Thermoleophilaceae bacterium]|nr:hypothetical protein [Thermoleophilaceae bacterium]